MRIIYVSNTRFPWCTESEVTATLRQLGYEVCTIQEDEATPEQFMSVARTSQMVLWTRTWNKLVTHEHLEELKSLGIPTVSLHEDLYLGLAREKDIAGDPFWATTHVFTADGNPDCQEEFKRRDINHHWLRPAVFQDEVYEADVPKVHDLVFIGSTIGYHPEYRFREQLVRWLRKTYGTRFETFGPQTGNSVRGEALNQLCASSNLIIGDSLCLDFSHKMYWSDRVPNLIGRGGTLIHPRIDGLEDSYILDGPEKELITYEYENWDQLAELIQYYTDNPEERETIRKRGFERTKRDHVWTVRIQEMLDIVFPPESANEPKAILTFDDPAITPERIEAYRSGTSDESVTISPLQGGGIRLNLGAGREPLEGWTNTDWYDLPSIDLVFNLLHLPYPFDDESAETVRAWDVLEHMPSHLPDGRSFPIELLNEIWRILKPGGEFLIHVPDARHPEWATDITHVRPYMPSSFDHFDPDTELGQMFAFYSERKWQITERTESNKNLTFRLVKRP